MPLEMLEDLFV